MRPMPDPTPYPHLDHLLATAPRRAIGPDDKLAIVSDLHMGDGGANDDFKQNGALFLEILRSWYWPRGYHLILNGDIEELLRAKRPAIYAAWPEIFEYLERFRQAGRLTWLRGNHEILPNLDYGLGGVDCLDPRAEATLAHGFDGEALRLDWQGRSILVFHGHQAGWLNSGRFNNLIGPILRIGANALHIGNYSVSQDSEKKIRIEKEVYDFARRAGVISMIGHTHRPLFESLSKREYLGFQIERLCREFARRRGGRRRDSIRQTIQRYRDEYLLGLRRAERHLADNVYGDILIPCLFNSGCGIGKRGVTSLEIKDDRVYLLFWSDRRRSDRALDYNEYRSSEDIGPDCYRFILRRETLDYIFSRIELLR